MQDQEYPEYIPLFTDRVTQSLKGESSYVDGLLDENCTARV